MKVIAQKAKIKSSPKNPDIEYLYTEFLLISANLIFKLVFHLHIYMQGSSHGKYPNHKIFNQDNMVKMSKYAFGFQILYSAIILVMIKSTSDLAVT